MTGVVIFGAWAYVMVGRAVYELLKPKYKGQVWPWELLAAFWPAALILLIPWWLGGKAVQLGARVGRWTRTRHTFPTARIAKVGFGVRVERFLYLVGLGICLASGVAVLVLGVMIIFKSAGALP